MKQHLKEWRKMYVMWCWKGMVNLFLIAKHNQHFLVKNSIDLGELIQFSFSDRKNYRGIMKYCQFWNIVQSTIPDGLTFYWVQCTQSKFAESENSWGYSFALGSFLERRESTVEDRKGRSPAHYFCPSVTHITSDLYLARRLLSG